MRGIFNRHKFKRHHVGALMQHLEKCMLAIGTRLTPQHGGSAVRQCLTRMVYLLAIAFHFKLLQVGRKSFQGAVIRCNTATGVVQKVAIPNIEQT